MTVPSMRPVIDACAAGSADHTTAAASALSVDNERRMCICVQRARSRAPDYSRGVPAHGRLSVIRIGFWPPALGFRTCQASGCGLPAGLLVMTGAPPKGDYESAPVRQMRQNATCSRSSPWSCHCARFRNCAGELNPVIVSRRNLEPRKPKAESRQSGEPKGESRGSRKPTA